MGSITREAARDLSAYQYHAVKINTDGRIDYANTGGGDVAIGVLQNAPAALGEAAEVAVLGTSLLYVTGGTTDVTVGCHVGSDSNYRGVKVTADKAAYFAVALELGDSDGDLVEVLLTGPQYLAA
jgi:hypothetical protein